MKIGLLVEGKTDVVTIRTLVRKIFESSNVRPKTIIRQLRGRGDMFSAEKIQTFIQQSILVNDPDVSIILICVDSHCTPPEEIQKKANQHANQKKHFQRSSVKLEGVIIALPGTIPRLLRKLIRIALPKATPASRSSVS